MLGCLRKSQPRVFCFTFCSKQRTIRNSVNVLIESLVNCLNTPISTFRKNQQLVHIRLLLHLRIITGNKFMRPAIFLRLIQPPLTVSMSRSRTQLLSFLHDFVIFLIKDSSNIFLRIKNQYLIFIESI